ncbi:Histone acetyltransferase [Cyphellophora attinorum]|uniref:histone acetyltransferase n=1 Tax=Cyphellophora attinorum TaxID=1664694 RepID=A0A0N0NJ40_9EURO|nr:Histone acetyltransferase [Phialophora attinorum]KPI36478.1 Histone acetyltransferase [Phialophora attinorum]
MSSSSASLSARLADALPRGTKARAYHISTTPAKTDAIYSAAPSQPEQTTYCESHFLVLATPRQADRDELAILALEVLIFTTPALTTVFVSKADSTGYASLLEVPRGQPSPIKSVVQAFIDFLLEPRLVESRVALSLFARAQDQYLFPGSIDNPGKHVLDDRQLIKWWCRITDAVWRPHASDESSTEQEISAHLLIPGLEKGETRAFFPPSSHRDPVVSPKWTNDYPVGLLATDRRLPVRCLIPRLPDDPKSRFLGDLDLDHVGSDGQWRTIKTLDQFWEFMSYRQECSAGRLVGFLWVVFVRPQEPSRPSRGFDQAPDHAPSTSSSFCVPQLPTPRDSQSQQQEVEEHSPAGIGRLEQALQTDSPPPSSPPSVHETSEINSNVPQTNDEKATGLESNEVATDEGALEHGVEVQWPSSTQGQVLLNADTYENIIDGLLRLDFTGEIAAAQSTTKWVSSVLEKSGPADFGLDTVGTRSISTPTTAETSASATATVPTMLLGVRKKRKQDQDDTAPPTEPPTIGPTVNVLSAGLVKKKPKVDKAT